MKKLSIEAVPRDRIIRSIVVVRGQKVILDADVASLYGVETRALVQAVKRNLERFPPDFMFRVTSTEMRISRSCASAGSSVLGWRRRRRGTVRRISPPALRARGLRAEGRR